MKRNNIFLKTLPILSGISIACYYVIRVFYYLRIYENPVDLLFGGLLLIGETYMVLHAFGFIINALRSGTNKPEYKQKKIMEDDYPPVAVVLAVKHEPKAVLEQTLITLKSLDYPNMTVYFLDGSTDPAYIEQDRMLAKMFDVVLFQPAHLHGAKAGALNDLLPTIQDTYIAIFDADQNPMPDFLRQVVSIAEADPNIAFVQTPQMYSNLDVGPIARGAAMQQSIFYETICEAKSRVNAMFCCGTNVLFRRDALLTVGGFDEKSVTEDFSTSVKLHMRGYRSVYYNHVRVFGMAPESLPAYFRQQKRWAAGTTGVFRHLLHLFFTNPRGLSVQQWWEYGLAGSYYFIGWAFFILMMCPILFLMFNIPSFFIRPSIYLVTFLPYALLTLAVFYGSMMHRHYGFREVYYGIILGSLSFPILMLSTVYGMIGRRLEFAITPKGKVDRLSFFQLLPWTTMIALNGVSLLFGIVNFRVAPWAIGVNSFWVLYHLFILTRIYRLNALPVIHQPAV